MEGQPKLKPGSSKLAYIPGAEAIGRIDAWWGLVILVAVLIVILVTVKADPFRNILFFVRHGIVITAFLTVMSFILTLLVLESLIMKGKLLWHGK